MRYLTIILSFALLTACSAQQQGQQDPAGKSSSSAKEQKTLPNNNPTIVPAVFENGVLVRVEKDDSEWKKELNDKEYNILREAGTERAFSGDLWDHKGEGTFTCAACHLPLFASETKFKSGTGWPSYYQPIKAEHVKEIPDNKYGWDRVEVVCARCDGHLGHIFKDGPKPTGLRYCINSYSLDFSEEKP